MKTLSIVLLVLVIVAVAVAVAVVGVAVWRFGRRSYQRYSGLERQRAAARQSRDAGVDRLKDAERELVRAQRQLIARGQHQDAQTIERFRVRLSTAADRHRYALHGYAPLGDPNPIREAELAELQARDSETIGDAQMINDLAHRAAGETAAGQSPDLAALEAAIDHLVTTLDRRKALT